MSERSALVLAGLAGVALALTGVVIRLIGITGIGPPTPETLVPVLVAAGGLCVGGLTARRNPSAAWLAIIAALTITTLDLAAFGRTNRVDLGPSGWRWLAILVCLGTLSATAAATVYATGPARRVRPWVRRIGWLALGVVVVVSVWVIATLDAALPTPPLSPLGNVVLVTRALLGVVLTFTAIGILGDLRPAAQRTQARLAEAEAAHGPQGVAAAGRIFVDELAPGRGRARRAASAERSRLAAELHADVVPAVRRALSEAEGGGSPERLAVALRDVLGEVDGLVEARHSVVLDELGLLAALEWLAERTEERSEVRVTIDVPAAAGPATPGRPPRTAEVAAFRIAQLAMENVIRHAPTASARLVLAVDPGRVRLVITDDGPGLPSDADRMAAASGRRGLADMRAEAEGCGGSVAVEAAGPSGGTVVRFDWPTA